MTNIKPLIATFILSAITAILATAYKEQSESEYYLTMLSTVCSVFTLIIAWMLYDKFDSNKLGFNKQTDAVDNLGFALANKKFTLCKCSLNELDIYAENSTHPLYNFTFYLNQYNLQNPAFGERLLPVYFSESYINFANELKIYALNPWLPAEIRNSLKPLLIYTGTQIDPLDRDLTFILVTSFNEIPDSNERIYSLKYEDKSIVNLGDLHDNFDSVLTIVMAWYNRHFDTVPDFSGH